MDTEQGELEGLRLELARAHGHIEELRTQLEVHSLEPTELREAVQALEQQLFERDQELEDLGKTLQKGDAWRREVEAARQEAEGSLTRQIDDLRAELELIKSTRLWRAGERYWALRDRLSGIVRRGEP